MKKLIPFIAYIIFGIITPGIAVAHSGHTVLEQIHSFIHAEYIFVMIGIAGALVINIIIRKRP